MKRTSFKLNWSSKAIALLAFVGLTNLGQAQTVLINDGFSGNNGLSGSTPDTTDTVYDSTAGTGIWVTGHYNRGINATWSPGNGVTSDYTGNGTVAAGISFAGSGENIDTLSLDLYKSTSDQAGNPLVFGFSTQTSLDNGVVDSGYGYSNNPSDPNYSAQVPNGGNFGFVLGTGGLGVLVNSDGSGSLFLNGGITPVANWSSPIDFLASAGRGSTVGENAFSLSYNNITDVATVTEAGDSVASVNVGALTLNSAGFGGFYSTGWNDGNGGAPDGFDNFVVTTQAAVPEPSSLALMLAGAMGLFFYRRFRTASQS